MDTRDTTEQADLRHTAHRLARELGPATVADLGDHARRARLELAVRDAGWLELRDDDGAGAGAPVATGVEACIVAEALGGTLADTPFAGPLLAADFARRAGTRTAIVAFDNNLVAPAQPESDDAYAVDVAHDADGAFVATDLTRSIARVQSTDQRALADDDLAQWTALGIALTSADLVGAMQGALDLTVAYAADRRQYGVPIGSFQAVQHLLADARTLLDGSRSVALHASWAVDNLPPAVALEAVRVAKSYCVRAARTLCETAIQVHGGIGNTWECLAHVYLRRVLLSSQWFGDDRVQLHALAATRLGAA
jgi:alkylation response protein AidB-like acyl-CoA dehydrogenase